MLWHSSHKLYLMASLENPVRSTKLTQKLHAHPKYTHKYTLAKFVKRKRKERLRLPSLAACIKERSPERQGPTTQTKRKRWHGSLHQQVCLHHGTYGLTVRQALSSKLKTHP
eukprot:1161350-Pelagomonas_calceolata.AAC.1